MPGVALTHAAIGRIPAGHALSRIVADEAELLLVATMPAMRRRGVAAALLHSIFADFPISSGAVTLHLEVHNEEQ